MIAQVAEPFGDLSGSAKVDEQEDTDFLSRPVVPAEDQAHEHPAAQESVDLTHEIEQQSGDEAHGDDSDELLIHQVRQRQPSNGEER